LQEYCPYLLDVYNQIVEPMESELTETLLIKFRLVNEGELFCSDFQYRSSDAKTRDFIGFIGKSTEDT